jgi:hypothetical protein
MKELELNEVFLLDYFVSRLALLLNFLMSLAIPSFPCCLSLHRRKLYSDGQFVRLHWDRSKPWSRRRWDCYTSNPSTSQGSSVVISFIVHSVCVALF